MEDIIREYLSMKQIQKLVKQGIAVEYTGWHTNTGYEYQHEVRYTPVTKPQGIHGCRIFDLAKTGDNAYRCQVCDRKHDSNGFNEIKQSAPVKFCSCGGDKKQMRIYIPHPVSGWELSPIFYDCIACGNKYMFYRDRCQKHGCKNTCDSQEIYCYDCQNLMI